MATAVHPSVVTWTFLKPDNSLSIISKSPTLPVQSQGHLVISPYTEVAHLLDLNTVGQQEQFLAQALSGLRAVRQDYAIALYIDAFNWDEIVSNLRGLVDANCHDWRKQTFYIVVFRSQIPQTTVYADLGVLDKAAHAEAVQSGGFLKYWFGHPDATGRNLATCIWRNKEDARLGSMGEAHRRAAAATRSLYSDWTIQRLAFVIEDGVGAWSIKSWHIE